MRIGILAGSGDLPAIAASEIEKQSIPLTIYSASIEEHYTNRAYDRFKDSIKPISISHFGEILKLLTEDKITHIVLLGKINKGSFFQSDAFDSVTLQLLSKMKDKNDDSFFFSMAQEFNRLGITILPQTEFLQSLLMKPGLYSAKAPSDEDNRDVIFGMDVARKIGSLDIGQTAVVRFQAVFALEAIEGTDECIIRSGQLLHGKGGVVCKAQKKNQDARFDMPTVGLTTLDAMNNSGCHLLAIEAGSTFVVTPELFIKKANQYEIIFMSV